MKISLDWLKTFIQINETPQQIAGMLTQTGLEVESIEAYEKIKGGLEGLVVASVLTCEKHPEADKLSKTMVDIGNGIVVPIVCGAPNVRAGQKVIVATVGATLYPADGEPFKIKKAKIRGEVSEGMICAEDEIGLGQSHDGIMVLETDLPAGTPAAQYFNLEKDYVFEIGLTPNRVDAASHLGVARDLRALLNKPLDYPSINAFKVDNNNLPIAVKIADEEACPRYAGLTISNISVTDSPDWLKTRLLAIGLSPINNVVDVTNYVLHAIGQPLHAFDADQIKGNQIIVQTVAADTEFVTLDNQKRKLQAHNLMVCNAKEPMAIAGIFGGAVSGVSPSTKRIFIESAYFAPATVRKSSQTLGIKTDSSFRFERGTDPNAVVYALKLAALLIKDTAGGEISSDIVDIYPNPVQDLELSVSYRNIDRLIGKELNRDLIHNILHNLDIQTQKEDAYGHVGFESGFLAKVPPYRVDVQREADVIEEILRIYGFDNIEINSHLKSDFLSEYPDVEPEKLQHIVGDMLAANGFCEMMNNSLTSPAYVSLSSQFNAAENVVILNRLSEDLGVLRQTLLFSGLEALQYNINRRQKDLKMFEFGKVYRKVEGGYEESLKLALFITGDKQAETWQAKAEKVDFHALALAVQQVLTRLNVKNLVTENISNDIFAYGLSYKLNNRPVVTVGLLSPAIAKKVDIKQAVFYADIDWGYLVKKYSKKIQYTEIAKFPEVRRDLSLVLDKQVSFRDIERIALQNERKLLKQVNVFDVYEGANIGAGKKSYSVSFILQDSQQTLTDQVIDKTMGKLMAVFENDLGAIIRK